MSTSEVNEHVTKRSVTALGHSLTNGAAVQFGRIREGTIIELFVQCGIAKKVGRTRVEKTRAGEFGNDVGV